MRLKSADKRALQYTSHQLESGVGQAAFLVAEDLSGHLLITGGEGEWGGGGEGSGHSVLGKEPQATLEGVRRHEATPVMCHAAAHVNKHTLSQSWHARMIVAL